METNKILKRCLEEKNVKVSRISKIVGFDLSKVLYEKRKITVDELLQVCKVADIDPAIFMQRKEMK